MEQKATESKSTQEIDSSKTPHGASSGESMKDEEKRSLRRRHDQEFEGLPARSGWFDLQWPGHPFWEPCSFAGACCLCV